MTGSVVSSVLSSAVVATSISAIAIVVNAWLANRLKQNSAIDSFRYEKLYELYTDIYSLKAINYDLSDMQNLVEQTSDRHSQVECIYNKALPLLENSFCKNADNLLSEEHDLSKKIVDILYSKGKEKVENAPLNELLLKRQDFEKAAKEAFLKTLLSMLK